MRNTRRLSRFTTIGIVSTALLATCGTLAGCGFVSAGSKAPVKPSTFVITGHVQIPLTAAAALTVGQPCSSPSGANDVVTGAPVIVSAPTGTKIARTTLGPGVVTGTNSAPECSFPFEIRNVPGGDASYGIAVASHAPQTFDGTALRAATPAIISITPTT